MTKPEVCNNGLPWSSTFSISGQTRLRLEKYCREQKAPNFKGVYDTALKEFLTKHGY